jgi:hypothetical protein
MKQVLPLPADIRSGNEYSGLISIHNVEQRSRTAKTPFILVLLMLSTACFYLERREVQKAT